jgi:hypothetical protein
MEDALATTPQLTALNGMQGALATLIDNFERNDLEKIQHQLYEQVPPSQKSPAGPCRALHSANAPC